VPGARLSVIGREPPDLGADAVQQGIDVLGRVPDVRPEVLRASVFVAPTRIGSGIRVKTIEALALGRAVVATPLGCAGIDVRAGEHLLVAEDPEAIADAIVALLRDPVGAQRLGAAAAARMAELYAWPILADRFDATYRAVVDGRRAVQPQRLDARAGER
jgi:glycosyltransferase involved in cell wall biosynthesis